MKLGLKVKLYALLKYLQGMDKAGLLEIPPEYKGGNLGGQAIEVTLPDCFIERLKGNHPTDKGKNNKVPTTSLYGWTVMYKLLERLERFNQRSVLERELIAALKESFGQPDMKVAAALAALDTSEGREENPLAERVEEMRLEIVAKLPLREDNTPRMLRKDNKKTLPRFDTVVKSERQAA